MQTTIPMTAAELRQRWHAQVFSRPGKIAKAMRDLVAVSLLSSSRSVEDHSGGLTSTSALVMFALRRLRHLGREGDNGHRVDRRGYPVTLLSGHALAKEPGVLTVGGESDSGSFRCHDLQLPPVVRADGRGQALDVTRVSRWTHAMEMDLCVEAAAMGQLGDPIDPAQWLHRKPTAQVAFVERFAWPHLMEVFPDDGSPIPVGDSPEAWETVFWVLRNGRLPAWPLGHLNDNARPRNLPFFHCPGGRVVEVMRDDDVFDDGSNVPGWVVGMKLPTDPNPDPTSITEMVRVPWPARLEATVQPGVRFAEGAAMAYLPPYRCQSPAELREVLGPRVAEWFVCSVIAALDERTTLSYGSVPKKVRLRRVDFLPSALAGRVFRSADGGLSTPSG